MEFDICMQPGFLRVIYFLKVFLNILRFVIPILLIVKTILDVYKGIINPKEDNFKPLKTRFIAAIIVFLVPTVINLLMTLINYIYGTTLYNGLSECWTFASPSYIEAMEMLENEEIQFALQKYEADQAEYMAQAKIYIQQIVENQSQNYTEVGTYANVSNQIACGSGSKYNDGLTQAVKKAGLKTREGVVAAAIYLSSQIPVDIPYFYGGGHTSNGKSLIGVSNDWGCERTMGSAVPDSYQQNAGSKYPNGLDCSGFVAWSILNGGYYSGSGGLQFNANSTLNSVGGIPSTTISLPQAKGKVKPGDLLHKTGHISIIVEVHDDKVVIAEEQGYKNGMTITEVPYSKSQWTVVLMDDFYAKYNKDEPIWEGFN